MTKIQYISASSCAGASREGTQEAPRILCQLLGVEPVCEINFPTVVEVCEALRDAVSQTNTQTLPIILGGDHSVALGSVAGSLMHDENLGVVWFDAHGDINTEETSPSGNAHGMPVAALMGLTKSELNTIAQVRLNPKHMFWVGTRSLDDGEKQIIKELGIEDQVYDMTRLRAMGMTAVMQEIATRMRALGIRHWHLSFDIDGMDPKLVPATGVPERDGMNQADLGAFIAGMNQMPELMSMDFVEYNPLMDDPAQSTGHWCAETLKKIIEAI